MDIKDLGKIATIILDKFRKTNVMNSITYIIIVFCIFCISLLYCLQYTSILIIQILISIFSISIFGLIINFAFFWKAKYNFFSEKDPTRLQSEGHNQEMKRIQMGLPKKENIKDITPSSQSSEKIEK